jgi:hypothetical protein
MLITGGGELNTGPLNYIKFGLNNARSAVYEAALLHEVIRDNAVNVLAVTETWIP